jgi:septum formation topological specificity factor MinE
MTTLKTHLAIIYFFDEETQMVRRVIFGKPKELYDFFLIQSVETNELLKEVLKQDPQTKAEYLDIMKKRTKTKKGLVQNSADATDKNSILEISYGIKETKAKEGPN